MTSTQLNLNHRCCAKLNKWQRTAKKMLLLNIGSKETLVNVGSKEDLISQK